MFFNVYSRSPTLDAEREEVTRRLTELYVSPAPDRNEIMRLMMQRDRLRARYGFDYTVLGNWLILVVGTAIMVELVFLLKAMQ